MRRDVWWGLYLTSLLGAGDLGESMGGGHDGTETIVRHQGPLGEAPGLPCRNRGRRGPLGGTGRLLPDRSLVLRQGALGSPDLPRWGRTQTMLDEYSRKGGLELEKLGTHGAETPR